MAKKDSNGAAYSKEGTITGEEEEESDRAQTEEEDSGARTARPSCQLAAHTVQETAL